MRPRWPGWERRDEPPLWRALLLPLDLAAGMHRVGAGLHRHAYASGWRSPRRLSCRVVSVGSLAVGGAGKTPAAAWIAAELRARGHRVVLASRGYRRRGRSAVAVVSDGRRFCADLSTSGDEARILAAHAPGVPVLVGADRGLVGLRAAGAFEASVLVLDDGFQHHRLARDVEIVVVDGGLGFGNGRLLPRGPLREPPSVLSRAHAVGVVDGPLPPEDAALLARFAPGSLAFRARRRPTRLRPLTGRLRAGGDALKTLRGQDVGMLAGVARPEGFRRTLESLGARVVTQRCFRDHHHYRRRDLRGLGRSARVWITTEKDAVKIPPAWVGVDLRVLEIEFEVEASGALLDAIESRLADQSR